MDYTIEQYRQALQSHDWFYDCTEDPRVYRRGAEKRQELYAMQYQLDRNFKIWNEFAPQFYQRTVVEDEHGDT